ncbi:MAG: hypothetical protein JWO89_235, partial [Verrucomicrobiaceae bacterium]|nr:hypothetical protein [Verrucomicrobiaceae bacterium]
MNPASPELSPLWHSLLMIGIYSLVGVLIAIAGYKL